MRLVVTGITVACILAVAVPFSGYLTARTVPTTAYLDPGLKHGFGDSAVVATRIEQGSAAGAAGHKSADPGLLGDLAEAQAVLVAESDNQSGLGIHRLDPRDPKRSP
jgi:hypothetical protein